MCMMILEITQQKVKKNTIVNFSTMEYDINDVDDGKNDKLM